MNATAIHKRNRDLEREGLQRFAQYCRKFGLTFTVKSGHGCDGYLDGVPVEVKVFSHTKHRKPGRSFPAHVSRKQLRMILDGGLLVHVSDKVSENKGISIYDKEAIIKHFPSQYALYLNHDAKLTKADLNRHIRAMNRQQRV